MSDKASAENESTDKRFDDLMVKMQNEKKKWDAEDNDDEEDETDALLSKAIEAAIAQGKGWKEGEKEAYLERIFDDDYLDPIFATTPEDLEKTGMSEAFSSLLHDDPPLRLMGENKQKGNEAFLNGKNNVAKNVQYYRDAINHYYEAFHWAQKVEPDTPVVDDDGKVIEDLPCYSEKELDELKSTILANAAMAHMQLKNWGYVRDDSKRSLTFNDKNIKAWYRLAKAHQMLQNWEEAGDAIDSGLGCDSENKELKKIRALCEKKIRKARMDRQRRERARAERVSEVKEVWKHCKEKSIALGRVPLVATVNDDDEEDGDGDAEARWHHHYPHTGRLPKKGSSGEWCWPCMFIYPSHKQSDFIEHFYESDILAMRMAEVFPELEGDQNETAMPWDYNNEFICSNLAVYFEVHCTEKDGDVIHPDFVQRLKDQGSTMRFYESSRALKGDEGPEMATVARCSEKKLLHKQRKAWIKKHKSLWSRPDACPVVRVHPAATLVQILTDAKMVVPNFLVTFLVFPENHPAHTEFLKERQVLGVLQPNE